MRRDVVAVGASAGGVGALQKLAAGLPKDFGAAILVVLHVHPDYESLVPHLLKRAGKLDARAATDGAALECGVIYVAPPDCHLLLEDNHLQVNKGPTENRHRPAIDPLFRSVAAAAGEHAIGVLLTGADDDGAAGLEEIQRRGGLTVVQDPHQADFPQMPLSALRRISVDYMLPIAEIAPLLVKAVNGEVQRRVGAVVGEEKVSKDATGFICPDCGGALWELEEGGVLRYRCRVGHAYTAQSLVNAEDQGVENALWGAVRSLRESAAVSRRVLEKSPWLDQGLAEQFLHRAQERERHAQVIEELLNKLE